MEAAEILRKTKIDVAPGTFAMISLKFEEWQQLLQNNELSPRGDAPFMILRDSQEVTLLLDETDFQTVRHAVRDARVEKNFRLLTFDIELDWTIIGFLSLVSKILADAEIPIACLSAFSRDHLLIKQEYLPKALQALRNHVEEIC